MKNISIASLRLVVIIIFSFFISFAVKAQVQTPKYGVSMTVNSNGYYEYLPSGYSSGIGKYPLLIFFHGLGELGDGSEAQLSKVLANGTPKQISQGIFPESFTVKGQSFKFIVLSPQFTIWPYPYDVDNIINYAIKNYRVDTSRIYLTGISMGGGVVWEYPGEDVNFAKRIAAMVPISGAAWPANFRCENIALGNVAVWATHNDQDPTVPSSYTIDFVNGINSQPYPPNPLAKKTIFSSTDHDAWTKTYDLNFKENGVNVYEWMLQYSRNIVLPVSTINFKAIEKNDKVEISWSTKSETNNRGFNVQRSIDDINFTTLSFVNSKSSLANGSSYTYIDNQPIIGNNYYRIVQVDENGKTVNSPVVNVVIKKSTAFTIFPNPVGNQLNIQSNLSLQNAKIYIRDMNGRNVYETDFSGLGNIRVPVSNLAPGMYSITIIEPNKSTQLSFIKR
ncbi:MAG: T9SS type A sorting domain-containing protein [Bacteroidetes bacterium]|nr:T9SS type A sorting domain-containing protein [Bacteroidota bacterium]